MKYFFLSDKYLPTYLLATNIGKCEKSKTLRPQLALLNIFFMMDVGPNRGNISLYNILFIRVLSLCMYAGWSCFFKKFSFNIIVNIFELIEAKKVDDFSPLW